VQLWQKISEALSTIIGILTNLFRQYFYEDKSLTLISLIIAIVLWGAVSKQETISNTLLGVPIDYVDLPPGLEIANDDFARVASIRVKGPKDTIEALRSDLLAVKINLSTTKPGERVITLTNSDVVTPPNVEIVSLDPQRTRLTIDPIIERQVKVIARFTGKIPEDYESTAVSVNPSTVTIRGPESRVRNIDEITTETISLSEHRTNFMERPNLDIRDSKVNLVGSPTIEVRIEIGQIRIERQLTNVAVHITPSTEKVSVNPVSVNVLLEGRKSFIESLSPADVSATVDVKDLPDLGVAIPKINLPPNFINAITVKTVEPAQISVKKSR
jgi:YbbR domain-containing protein